MNFFSKTRPGQDQPFPHKHPSQGNLHPARGAALATATASAANPSPVSKGGRQSNGLKEFLWQLDGIGHGHLLDLGPARQSTLNFVLSEGLRYIPKICWPSG